MDARLAEKAVNWWGEAIANPKFDNGESGMHVILAEMNANNNRPSESEIEEFKKNLFEEIMNADETLMYVLDCDYSPCTALSRAALKAGINNTACFPWKTIMKIEPDYVMVSYGYNAPFETI